MKLDRLFHVLVVMAAPTMVACDSADQDGDERRDGQTDAGAGSAADAPAASTSDGGPAEPCFCNTQTCCDRSTSDPYVLEGFECCWSTTCP
jgi:hypothetical protein